MTACLQAATRYIVMTIPYFILMKRFGYDGEVYPIKKKLTLSENHENYPTA